MAQEKPRAVLVELTTVSAKHRSFSRPPVTSGPIASAWIRISPSNSVQPVADSTMRLPLAGRFDATDKRHDQRAKAIYANGDTYLGQYSNDRRQGVGLYLVAKGGGYAGSYAESNRSGQGLMRMPDGAVYQGDFAGDKLEGQGQYEYVDGSTYVGAWKAGKKHGEVCCGDCLIGSDTPRVLSVHCGRHKWLMTRMSCQSVQHPLPKLLSNSLLPVSLHDQGMRGSTNAGSASY